MRLAVVTFIIWNTVLTITGWSWTVVKKGLFYALMPLIALTIFIYAGILRKEEEMDAILNRWLTLNPTYGQYKEKH